MECNCEIESKEFIISEIINEENILSSYNFTNNSSSLNIFTMKCIYTLFSEEGLKTNIGHYVMIIIVLIFMVISILQKLYLLLLDILILNPLHQE